METYSPRVREKDEVGMTVREYVEQRVGLYIEELNRYKPQFDKETKTHYIEINGTYEGGIPSLEEYRDMISDDVNDSFCLYDDDDLDFDVDSLNDEDLDVMIADAFADFEAYYLTVIEMRKPYEEL